MRVDKKARGNRLRFVVLDGLARPAILEGPDDALLRAGLRRRWPAVKVYVLNGPNLGRLGTRQVDVYGTTSYADLVATVRARRARSSGWTWRSGRPTPSTR